MSRVTAKIPQNLVQILKPNKIRAILTKRIYTK